MTEIRTLKQRREDELARMREAIRTVERALARYAREHGGRYVIYGSVARGEYRPDSDIDIMVDFPDDARLGAEMFAEDICWQNGLTPDVRGKAFCGDRLMERIARDGQELQ